MTLDLSLTPDRDAFLSLVSQADFIIESFEPGFLQALDLDYSRLREVNSRIIFISITPYGQSGPHSRWKASDINLQGMGGHLLLSGDVERPPVRLSIPASYWHGGCEGLMAALIAHHWRQKTGRGQHVDVSIQQCIIWTLLNTTMTWQLVRRQETRGGARKKERGNSVYTRLVWPCADGLVFFIPIGGGGGLSRQHAYTRFVEWMREEGFHDPRLTAKDWNNKDMFSFSQEEFDQVSEIIEAFLKTKNVRELYRQAIDRRLLLAPIATAKDIIESDQLNERKFFIETTETETGKSVRWPGAFARFSETPLKPGLHAPKLGEHNKDLLKLSASLARE